MPGAVGVRVHDTGPGTPVLGRSRLGALRGRGLLLVRHVASEWGSKPDDTGKTVWATVAVGPRRLAEPTAGAGGGEPAG